MQRELLLGDILLAASVLLNHQGLRSSQPKRLQAGPMTVAGMSDYPDDATFAMLHRTSTRLIKRNELRQTPSKEVGETTMGIALILFAALLAWAVLLGTKTFAVFGLLVSCAMFQFPLGIIAIVAAGVALLFLLAPRHEPEQSRR